MVDYSKLKVEEIRKMIVQNDFDFFPTPVSVINLGEESRPLNKQIMDAVWKEKEASNKQQRTGINIFQSFYNLEKKHKIFADLQKMFMDLCKPAIARAGFGGMARERELLPGEV